MDPLAIISALADSGASEKLRMIAKALTTVGGGSNLGALTGGPAMRAENLDPVMAATVVQNQHFKFTNMLMSTKRDSFSMLDQVVTKTATGGFPGSAISSETGKGNPERVGDYARVLTELGVFTTRRSVTLVTGLQAALQQQSGIVDFSASEEEDVNAALEILLNVEHSLFYGNRAVVAESINGIFTQIDTSSPLNIIDMRGAPVVDHIKIVTLAGRLVTLGNWGSPDRIFCSQLAKADLDKSLAVGYRVNLDERIPGTEVGVPIKGIRFDSVAAQDGLIQINASAFITEDKTPIVVGYGNGAATLNAPASITAALPAADPNSLFIAGQNGNYFYAVEAWSAGQVSIPTVIATAVALAVGNSAVLTITQSSGGAETFYKIYRGRKNGTNANADLRYIGMIAKAGGTTVFTDLNVLIPGCSEMAIITNRPEAVRWVQMLPLTKVPFAMTDFNYPWGAILLGALRVAGPKKHGYIKNILPSGASWLPFG